MRTRTTDDTLHQYVRACSAAAHDGGDARERRGVGGKALQISVRRARMVGPEWMAAVPRDLIRPKCGRGTPLIEVVSIDGLR